MQRASALRVHESSAVRRHGMPFGAEVLESGEVRFRLWAPAHQDIQLVLEDNGPGEDRGIELAMQSTGNGWHEMTTELARPGTRYRFQLPGGQRVPDPASRFQPEDVHGPSEVVDPAAYEWEATGWRGRPWHEAVLYELHTGAFTAEGTFRGAIEKLDYLAELGVTAIELMPVADFPGRWNWGYDGVLPYAPDSSYGRPEDLKAFVDAAHQRGLMVLLDVVYNHFGPDGNYLSLYAPDFFTDRHKTPWGPAVNFDGPGSAPVREFIIHNALYWLEEFHLDGLRLDAVHQIKDGGRVHILSELADRVHRAAGDRQVHLALENEENEAWLLKRDASARPMSYTAQWNDDIHHALHTAATGEGAGYYADYLGHTDKLGRALAEGFAYQGEVMSYRGTPRGEPSSHLPPPAFVAFIQNHDQAGNRAFGERIGTLARPEAVKALAAVYLLAPQTPMLFMGEEWNAPEPFPFFCDFAGELGDAVRKGRREEFARFPEFRDPEKRSMIPDPQAAETFHAAKLWWEDLSHGKHAEWLAFYRRLLRVRRDVIVPLLGVMGGRSGRYRVMGHGAVEVEWPAPGEKTLVLAANLSDTPLSHTSAARFPCRNSTEVWRQGTVGGDGALGAWSVRWCL